MSMRHTGGVPPKLFMFIGFFLPHQRLGAEIWEGDEHGKLNFQNPVVH